MPTNLVTIDQSGAPAGLLASTSLATIDQPLPPPAILGWNYQGRVVGAGELARITWKGIFKASAATVVAAGSTAVRGANLAIAEIETTRGQLQGQIDLLTRQRNDAVNRAAAAEAKASRKAQRWSDAEKAHLATFFTGAKHKPYAAIAANMADTFGRTFTAASVGSQARKLGLVAKPALKVSKAPSKSRKRRAA